MHEEDLFFFCTGQLLHGFCDNPLQDLVAERSHNTRNWDPGSKRHSVDFRSQVLQLVLHRFLKISFTNVRIGGQFTDLNFKNYPERNQQRAARTLVYKNLWLNLPQDATKTRCLFKKHHQKLVHRGREHRSRPVVLIVTQLVRHESKQLWHNQTKKS